MSHLDEDTTVYQAFSLSDGSEEELLSKSHDQEEILLNKENYY